MFRFLHYIWKTLWRHRARTMLTVSGSAVALFVFCLVSAVQEGMRALHHGQEARQTLVAFQANKFCPATSHLPQDYGRTIDRIEGVREVVPIQVFTNNCRASLDVVVFYGMPAAQLRKVRDFTLVNGSWSDFEQRQDAALVGTMVAKRRRIEIGDKFSMGQVTVSVAGIYASSDPAEESYIYTHLDFLQRGKGWNRVGAVTQFEILLEPGSEPMVKCREIDDAFRDASVRTTTRPKGAFQARSLGDLTQLIELAHYLGITCVGLVLVLVATTTVMSVQDRVREHGVLLTIGFSSPAVFCLVLVESVLLSLMGGAVGVAAALAVLQGSGLAVGAEGVMVAFRPSVRLAVSGMAVSLVAGVLAGIAPAWQAARTDIVSALRQA